MKKCILNLKTTFSFLILATTVASSNGQSLAVAEKGTNDLAFYNVFDNEKLEKQSLNKTILISSENPKSEFGNTSLSHNNAANNFNYSPCPPTSVYNDATYRDVFSYSNRAFAFCFCGGALGLNSKITLGGGGVSMTICGVYLDFIGSPTKHGGSTEVKKWKDTRGVTFHAGYQVPIARWLRIIPEIGYYSVTEGTTDGSNYSVDKNGIHNKYTVKWKDSGLDYGGVLVLHLFHCFDINFAVTKNTMYGGLGVDYSFGY